MKKIICLAAALTLALTACGGPSAQESNDPAPTVTALTSAAPTPAVPTVPAAAESAAPSAAPSETPAVSEPSAETPAATFALTPAPTESAEPPGQSAAPSPSAVPAADTPTPTAEPTSEPMAVTSVEPTATSVPTRPGDEEVLAAYHQAEEAFRWFDLTTLPLDFTQPKSVGEEVYYPVSDERFATMDDLRGYLKGLFSDEIVDALLPLNGTHYADIDGALCAIQADRGANENTGPATETVDWPAEGGDALCTVRVSVELLWEDPAYPDGVRKYEFPYQKVGDKWVFTYFEAIM